MKNFLKLGACIIVCELVGIIGAVFTSTAIPTWYQYLQKPFFAPPNWLFGPVWTLLYMLMGVSLFLILNQGWKKKKVKNAVMFFVVQLTLNFAWSPLFFGLRSPLFGLITIITMWVAILLAMKKFYPLSKTAAYLLLPYLLWVSFATMLNAAILLLNK